MKHYTQYNYRIHGKYAANNGTVIMQLRVGLYMEILTSPGADMFSRCVTVLCIGG